MPQPARLLATALLAAVVAGPAAAEPPGEDSGEVPVAEALTEIRAACTTSLERGERTGLVTTWYGFYRLPAEADTMHEFQGRDVWAVNWRRGRSMDWTTHPPKGSVLGADEVKNSGPWRDVIAWPQGDFEWIPSKQRPARLRKVARIGDFLDKPKLHWERDPWWYPDNGRPRQKRLYHDYLRAYFKPPTKWGICRDPQPKVLSATKEVTPGGTLWTLTVPNEVDPSHPARNPVTILVDPSGVIVEMLAPRYHLYKGDQMPYAEARQPLRYTWEYRSQRIEIPCGKRTVSTPLLLRACEQLGIDGCTYL